MDSGVDASERETATAPEGWAERRSLRVALLACAVLAILWVPSVSMERSWGWDESMHAAYPAARMAVALGEGEGGELARAVHDCRRYPFAYPGLLGVAQAVVGISERAGRVVGRLLWCVGIFGLFLLGREVARAVEVRNRELLPWLAAGLGALSPLALAYSGSYFLEVPFLVVSTFALRAWLRRGPDGGARRELAAGAWLTLAFFTKFNYGLLLGFALALALALEAFGELRARRLGRFARRAGWLALPPLVGFAWWFVLPLPFGADEAALHRAALLDFLSGNTDASMRIPWRLRVVDWTSFFAFTPRLLVVQTLGLVITLRRFRDRAVRTLWIALLAQGLPIWTHNFHQDRFLLAPAAALWLLAALGLGSLLPRRSGPRAAVLAALASAALVAPSQDSWKVLEWIGMAKVEHADYQRRVLSGFQDLSGDREVRTNGLLQAESAAYLDLVEPEVAASTRVGFVGMSQAFSPAALWLGLMERGLPAPPALRAGELERSFITTSFVDPGWSTELLHEWSRNFDLLLATDPIDLTAAARRAFLVRYRDELAASEAWVPRELGSLTVTRPTGASQSVRIFAMEPGPGR